MISPFLLAFCIPALAPQATAAGTNGNLVANGGFENGEGTAIPGWEALSWGPGGTLDVSVSQAGKRSVRVSSHGGVQTRPLPYRGGRLRVSGWMRTMDLVRGPSRPWHKAALQLISLDAEGEPVGHFDIALVEGTTPWTRHERTVLLSREVAAVAVRCHIWGADAKGVVWFDTIAVEQVDDPKAIVRRPFDAQKATVTVDFSRDLGPFRHLWIGSDVSYMDRVVSATQVNAMRHARRFGFRYIRMHDCIHNPGIYSEDNDGNAVYRWETFDRRINTVAGNGMLPVIVLETVPPEIAKRDSGKNWTNPFPPAGDSGYRKWQGLVHALVKHCRDAWGEGIHDWYFEVWNEPDAGGYFKGTQAEYLRLYDHAVAGATAADPDIRIGGPGGAGTGWLKAFLEHCHGGINAATGGFGARVDFLSWHIYTVGVGIPVFDNLPLSCSEVRRLLARTPEFRHLPTFITEWGCASSPHPAHDRPYDAAFRTMAVRVFLDHDVTLTLPFALGAGPPHAHEGFQGGLAMFTRTTIPKPSFRAFELLHRMQGPRVPCESSNEPVGGLACVSNDRRRAWVTLYNLAERHDREAYTTAVTLKLQGLDDGTWQARSTLIAPEVCDPYLTWKDMGSPETLSEEQRTTLLEASELPQAEPVHVQGDALHLDMPGFAVMQIELERRP